MRENHWHFRLLTPLFLTLAVSACAPAGTPTPTLVDMEPAIQLSAGLTHTCATLQNGNAGCWGYSDKGAFGKAVDESASAGVIPLPIVEKVVSVGAGTDGSCAVVEDKTVRCWGHGIENQLGLGLACNAGYGGCLFSPTMVPGLTDILAVVARKGPSYLAADEPPGHVTCALDASNVVRCWGAPNADELGRGMNVGDATHPEIVVDDQGFIVRDIMQISAGDLRICAVDVAGSVWCWGWMSSHGQPGGVAARRIELPGPATRVAAGIGHSCAVLNDGRVACWGRNVNGECGVSYTTNAYCDCSEGTGCVADCIQEPNIVPGISNAVGVAAGEYHSCAWTAAGEALCWGSNEVFQVGDSTRAVQLSVTRVSALTGKVVDMTAGSRNTCALMDDGRVFCWGGS